MGQMAGAIPAAVSTERRKLGGVGNALCAVGSFACELVNEQRPPNTCGHFKLCHNDVLTMEQHADIGVQNMDKEAAKVMSTTLKVLVCSG